VLKAAVALCALSMCACMGSVTIATGTPTPSTSSAETPAANLRVRADVLFGEHAFIVSKLAVAAATGRKDEFHSYAAVLAVNGGDIETLLRSALGETAGGQFGDAWSQQNNSLVDYMVAAVTHDQKAADAAASSLTGASAQEVAAALTSGASIETEQAQQLVSGLASALKLVIDDAAGAAYPTLYGHIVSAHVRAVSLANAIVENVAKRFQDRFPGDPAAKAAEFRAGLDSLLQRQAYLMTMAGEAALASTPADVRAVFDALTTNSQALSSLVGGVLGEAAGNDFGSLWSKEASLVPSYAKSGDAAVRQDAIASARPEVIDALEALFTVVDDQRAKSYAGVATEDRMAASAMAAAGDVISATARL
jgi:hypothetical protein